MKGENADLHQDDITSREQNLTYTGTSANNTPLHFNRMNVSTFDKAACSAPLNDLPPKETKSYSCSCGQLFYSLKAYKVSPTYTCYL